MKKALIFLTLWGGGMLFMDHSLSCVYAQKTEETVTLFPFTFADGRPEKENADRRAGDNAFAAGDYAVAVSFYETYLEDCRRNSLPGEELEAYERLLEALVRGKFTLRAERCLAEYEKRFPQKQMRKAESAIWRGEIFCQRGKYKEAELLYRNLLGTLPDRDPRFPRVLFAYALTLEKLLRYREAASVFLSLWQKRSGSSPLLSQAFQHAVLCFAESREWEKAQDMLLKDPPGSAAENEIYALLEVYLLLRKEGCETAGGVWNNLLDSFRKKKDPLWYLVASAYGDSFLKSGNFSAAQDSYRAAFHAADDSSKTQETLRRMVAVLSAAGDVKKAAALAVRYLELYRHAMLKGELKLQTAALLRDSAKYKEALSLYESVFANMASSREERNKALYEYALILGKLGRFPEAEKTVRENLKGQSAVDGEFLLAEVLVRLKAGKEFIKAYETIAASRKEHALKAWMLCTRACVDQSMPGEALATAGRIRKALKNDLKTLPDLYYLEAAAYSALKDSTKALALYREFLRRSSGTNPLYPLALYHCGVLSFSCGRYTDAVRDLSRLKKEYPDHKLIPEGSAWLIQAYMILNDEVSVERETWLLAHRYPDSEYAVECQFRLAQQYTSDGSGENSKALQILTRLAAKGNFPGVQARALYELALYWERNNRHELAVRELNKLYGAFPDMAVIADAYYLHGDILRKGSDFKSAVFFYRKVTDLQKNTALAAAAHGSIGDCLFAIASADPHNSVRELNAAIKAYRTMQGIGERPAVFDAMGYYRIGRCLESLGQRRKAAVEYLKVLYKFPAREISGTPEAKAWCVRSAEALIALAQKNPLRSTLTHARTALHWLCDAGLLRRQEAAERFEKLKSYQLNP